MLDNTGQWSQLGTVNAKHWFTPSDNIFFVNAAAYGARGSVGSNATTASINAGSNLLTMTLLRDYQVGDDVRLQNNGAGPANAQPPVSVSATPCGNPRNTLGCTVGTTSATYYVSIDDGALGLSVSLPASVTTNASAQTTVNDTFIKVVPPQNQMPAVIWKNTGGADTYLGIALPVWDMSITSGSGYTNGIFFWQGIGGGCDKEPQGYFAIMGGQITQGRVDQAALGHGCTSNPIINVNLLATFTGSISSYTLNVTNVPAGNMLCVGELLSVGSGAVITAIPPNSSTNRFCSNATGNYTINVPLTVASTTITAGLNAGIGGIVSIAFSDKFDDTGLPLPFRNPYIPTSHLLATQPDALIATIGAINVVGGQNVFTLCAVGTIVPCTPVNAVTTQSATSVYHSWTSTLQAAINAAPTAGIVNGVTQVKVGCGVFDYEGLTLASNHTYLIGSQTSDGCTSFRRSGFTNGVSLASGYGVNANFFYNVGVSNIRFLDDAATGGHAIFSQGLNWLEFHNLYFWDNAGAMQILGFNSLILDHINGNSGWGYGMGDYDFESTFWRISLVIRIYDTYFNNGAINDSLGHGGIDHHGYIFDDVATVNTSSQCAISDEPGYGFWFRSTTGVAMDTSGDSNTGHSLQEDQFYHMQCDAEFSNLDEFRVDAGWWGSIENQGFSNGSLNGYELYINKNTSFNWFGGKMWGGYSNAKGSVYLDGFDSTISGASINYSYTNGVELFIDKDATQFRIANNGFGLKRAAANYSPPIEIVDANVGPGIITGNTFETKENRVISDLINPNDTTAINNYNAKRTSNIVIQCNAGDVNASGHSINDCTPTLGQLNLPMIFPSSGNVGQNGTIALTTPLDQVYANSFMYFPAGALFAGQTAAAYFAQCTSTTACTVYKNFYPGGTPTIPTTLISIVSPLMGAYTQTTGSNIGGYYMTVPAYQLGQNDGFNISVSVKMPNTTTTKAVGAFYGGCSFASTLGIASDTEWSGSFGLVNRGVTNSQARTNVNNSTAGGSGTGLSTFLGCNVDTTKDQQIIIQPQLIQSANDWVVFQSVRVNYLEGLQ